MCSHSLCETDSCCPMSGWYERRWAALVVIKPDVARVISPVRTFTPFSQSQSDVWQLFTDFLQDWLSMPGSIKPCESACSHSVYWGKCVTWREKREWMTKKWGEDGEGRRRANTFNKQTNEWVSWTVMRCFIDAIGKLLFCLLVSTGRSDLQYSSLPGTGQVSLFLLVDTSAGLVVYRAKDSVLKPGHPSQAQHESESSIKLPND